VSRSGVRYVIIDRPLADNQNDAGWRAGKGIVEIHRAEFIATLDAALARGILSQVSVPMRSRNCRRFCAEMCGNPADHVPAR